MGCSRRMFLGAGAAFLAVPGFAGTGKPKLRVGIVSDLHLETRVGSELTPFENLDRAFRHFDELKADAILACGDLTNLGTERSLLQLGEIWRKTFPHGCRSDGSPVANLFHLGDHDAGGYAHKWGWAKSHCADPDEELAHPLSEADMPVLWKTAFGVDWQPIMIREVKGYTFVLANHPPHGKESQDGQFIPGVAEALASLRYDKSRPVFYSQHRGIPGTVHGNEACGLGGPEMFETLKRYGGIIAFTGHAHANCADEKSLWQGEFTAVAVPSLRNCGTRLGRENSFRPMIKGREVVQKADGIWESGQYLFMSVYEDCVTIARYDVTNRASLGPDWVIPLPLPNDRVSFAERAKKSVAPRFPQGACVRVELGVTEKDRKERPRRCIRVSFPPAHATASTPRAYDYEVRVGLVVRRVFSANAFWADEKDVKSVYCLIDCADLPERLDGLVVSVSPADSFGHHGMPIETVIPSAGKADEERGGQGT